MLIIPLLLPLRHRHQTTNNNQDRLSLKRQLLLSKDFLLSSLLIYHTKLVPIEYYLVYLE
jgi:hypothetical protein